MGLTTRPGQEPLPKTVLLAGNPNVGKSTLFNGLTGLRQHTGNWTGKTVGAAEGLCRLGNRPLKLVDLPGTYSLFAHSEEERVAEELIRGEDYDLVAVVCDATCLERNLILVLQILSLTDRVAVLVNLMDEAEKKGIKIDLPLLETRLGVPVLGLSAREEKGIDAAVAFLERAEHAEKPLRPQESTPLPDLAGQLAAETVHRSKTDHTRRDRRIDRILTGKIFGFPIMLLLLTAVFWITMKGANIPSEWLSRFLFWVEDGLVWIMNALRAPDWLIGALVHGVYRTVAWVVSVMLPPMAIFFPLFTILEDLGYLPRVAFNLDRCFKKCNACGKQALTM